MSKRKPQTPAQDARAKLVEAVIVATLSHQVASTREARGWTQGELAEKSGLSTSTIQRVERGEYPLPTIETLDAIAKAFDCAIIVQFVGWEEFFAQVRTHFDPVTPFSADRLLLLNPDVPV